MMTDGVHGHLERLKAVAPERSRQTAELQRQQADRVTQRLQLLSRFKSVMAQAGNPGVYKVWGRRHRGWIVGEHWDDSTHYVGGRALHGRPYSEVLVLLTDGSLVNGRFYSDKSVVTDVQDYALTGIITGMEGQIQQRIAQILHKHGVEWRSEEAL
jgi:hypothetical protein